MEGIRRNRQRIGRSGGHETEVIEYLMHLVHDVVVGVGPTERLPRKGKLPAHEEHQPEAEEEEEETGPEILDADDFVVGGKDVGPPKAELVMLVRVIVMGGVAVRGGGVRGSGGFGAGGQIVHSVTGWRYDYTFFERCAKVSPRNSKY